MGLNATAHIEALKALLPGGPAWNREVTGKLRKLLAGIADELVRLDARIDDLLDEMDPRTATETLDQWEAMLGLPDPCAPVPTTTEDRRAAIIGQLLRPVSGTKAFFISLAAAMGYDVTIIEGGTDLTEFGPAEFGAEFGTGNVQFQWNVFGVSGPIDDMIECLFERYAPAHTTVRFNWS